MISFTYTKDSGEVSERTVSVLSKPRPNYLVVDCTDLDTAEVDVVEELVIEYEEAMEAAWKSFQEQLSYANIVGKVKSFKPSCMSNIQEGV